jgi:hypothetical protein
MEKDKKGKYKSKESWCVCTNKLKRAFKVKQFISMAIN